MQEHIEVGGEMTAKNASTGKNTPDKTTFRQIADEWLSNKARSVGTNAYNKYQLNLHVHVLPELGDSPMAKTPNLVQDIINKKAAEVSPATIRQIVTVIRQIFSIALDRKLIQRLPRIVIPEMNERIREIPTPEQVQFILWASETSKHGFGLWLKLGTGMSWSEMLALNWQDFDNLNRTVSVNKAFVRANGSYEVKDIKTREDLRQIALPRKVNDILAKKKKVGKMFQTESGQYLTPGSWQRLWNEWLKQANVMIEAHNTKLEEGEKPVPSIRNVRFHELRLFYASTLLAEKVTPDVAQILIGYKEIIALQQKYNRLIHDRTV